MGSAATVLAMKRNVVVLLLLFLPSEAGHSTADVIEELESWLHENGGFFEFEVKSTCPTCPRGTFARRRFKEGEIIAMTPLTAAVNLGPHGFENGDMLYERLVTDHDFNQTFGAFWRTQPTADEILGLEMFTPALLKLLHSDTLQAIIRGNQRARSAQFFDPGGVRDRVIQATDRKLVPSFSQYNYVSAIVTSRAFSFTNTQTQELNTFLLPATDMINHSTKRVNVARQQTGNNIEVVATKDIEVGEELYYEYDPGVVHRADMCLLIYGFVPEDEDETLLAAIDLPNFSTENPYSHTPREDDFSQYLMGVTFHKYKPDREQCRRLLQLDPAQEMERVRQLLAEAELYGTLQQDRQLLAELAAGQQVGGTEGWGWKEREVVKFRVRRKTALHARVAALEALQAKAL